MWFAILLSELFERPKGKVLRPEQIKYPKTVVPDLLIAFAVIAGVLAAMVLGIASLF